MEYTTTWETFGMSKPRPMTSVAMRIRVSPLRNLSRTCSRVSCGRPPWIASASMPSAHSFSLSSLAKFFWLTKMSILPSGCDKTCLMCASRSCLFSSSCFSHGFGSSGQSTTTTCWTMPSRASSASSSSSAATCPPPPPPLRPMRIIAGASAHKLQASCWTSFGQVAEKNTVCRSGRIALPIWSMSPLKPISSMRSASSKQKKVTLLSETLPSLQKSMRRPGVATRMCEPS
mmetsp:Transcript_125814/g.361785  ORF Transcript_125814/g.361785 Transcript_125814/m.361785 type:complete len:231 (+) Transcript_125814:569-1261(+)